MEYEYDYYQQEKAQNAAREREMNAYERGRGISKPIGMYNPEISVHIIQPQELKDLVQRLTGAPQHLRESSPRSPSPKSETPPASYNHYAAENTYYSEQYQQQQQQQQYRSMSSYNQYPSSSRTQQNYCYSNSSYEPCSPYSVQSTSPHSPQPFAVMDLPPLSPRDHIWAQPDGWR